MQKLLLTLQLAIRQARANVMHTLLSVLGIVIGVGALVAILSMIDGMEKYANDQISSTTSLEGIFIITNTTHVVDNVRVKKQDHGYFGYHQFTEMLDTLSEGSKGFMIYSESGYLMGNDSTQHGAAIRGILATSDGRTEVLAGRIFYEQEVGQASQVMVINEVMARNITKDSLDTVIGKRLTYDGKELEIIGVVNRDDSKPVAFMPITLFADAKLKQNPPECIVWAASVEEVDKEKATIEAWVNNEFGEKKKDFNVVTNQYRVKQANQGFLLFRIIMGMIVGISVLVGGIGVMNVLLISVTERTAEIGVRKAVGAKRKDIIMQFLSESVTISIFGSALGVMLGIGFTLVTVPVIKHFTEMPFEAAYTLNTLLVIGVLAVIVGVVFGTYPAMKAAKLDPVEAIRRE